jgi:phosphoinositide-3-kinase regulatory subunit 4
LDLTTLEIKLNMQQPAEYGRITSLYVDPRHTWVITGTSEGVLTVWDLRYGFSVRQWSCPGRVLLIRGHPGSNGKWIVVSCASPRITEGDSAAEAILYVYDVASTHVTQILAVTSKDEGSLASLMNLPRDMLATDAEHSPAKQISNVAKREGAEDIEQDLDPFAQDNTEGEERVHHDILAVHSVHGPRASGGSVDTGLGTVPESTNGSYTRAGDDDNRPAFRQTALIATSGEDRIIRLWNMTDIPASMVISGSGRDAEKAYRCVKTTGHRG